MIRNETKIQNELDKRKFKTQRSTSVKLSEFKKLELKQIWEMFDKNTCVTNELIQEKAKRIIESLNTNGWLYKFKKRKSFKCYRLHGESADANIEGIISELPKLREKLSDYSINDIFNTDEFGFF